MAAKEAENIKTYFDWNRNRYTYIKPLGNGEWGVAALVKQNASYDPPSEERMFVVKRGLGKEKDQLPNEIGWLQVSERQMQQNKWVPSPIINLMELMQFITPKSACAARRISSRS